MLKSVCLSSQQSNNIQIELPGFRPYEVDLITVVIQAVKAVCGPVELDAEYYGGLMSESCRIVATRKNAEWQTKANAALLYVSFSSVDWRHHA